MHILRIIIIKNIAEKKIIKLLGCSKSEFDFSESANFAVSYDVKRPGRAMKHFGQFSFRINSLLVNASVAILIFLVVYCVAKKTSTTEHCTHVIHSLKTCDWG